MSTETTETVPGLCRCVYDPCQLHGGHCCFRTTDSGCHREEILAATRVEDAASEARSAEGRQTA